MSTLVEALAVVEETDDPVMSPEGRSHYVQYRVSMKMKDYHKSASRLQDMHKHGSAGHVLWGKRFTKASYKEYGINEDEFLPAERHGKALALPGGKPLPKHAQGLGVPPAWKNVHVETDSKAHAYFKGKDKKGRTQQIQNPEFAKSQNEAKHARVQHLMQEMPKVHEHNKTLLNHPQHGDAAHALHLISTTGIRPGSTKDTKGDKKAYGATTLEGRHVVKDAEGKTHLHFTGKKGVDLHIPVTDKTAADELHKRAAKAGPKGRLFNVSAGQLRDHVHSIGGKDFHPKDFRTLRGTPEAHEKMKTMPHPKSEKEYKKHLATVGDHVAGILGNTRAVALKSYINPHLFHEWRKSAGVKE